MNYRVCFSSMIDSFNPYIKYVDLKNVMDIHIMLDVVIFEFPTCRGEFRLKDIDSISILKG